MSERGSTRNLSRVYKVSLGGLGVLVVGALALWFVAPQIGAYGLIGTAVLAVLLVVALVRAVDIYGPGTLAERAGAVLVTGSGLLVAGTGTAILMAGGATSDYLVPGVVAGGLLGVAVVVIDDLALERPRLAATILALLGLVALAAAGRALAHLIGVARAGVQASIAASGFLGLVVVLSLFVGIRLWISGVGTIAPGLRRIFGGP